MDSPRNKFIEFIETGESQQEIKTQTKQTKSKEPDGYQYLDRPILTTENRQFTSL